MKFVNYGNVLFAHARGTQDALSSPAQVITTQMKCILFAAHR